MTFRTINLDHWPRKNQFEFYKNYEQPFFNVTANIDVSNLYQYCKKNQYSFFLSCLYISTKTANNIEAFRTRLVDEKAIVYDKINTGSTVLKDDNTFFFCHLEFFDNLKQFLNNSSLQIDIQKNQEFTPRKTNEQDVLFHSTIPWISFTSVQHAQDSQKGLSVPKIVFGKYFKEGHRLLMPLSVEVHHALADGYHVGLFYQQFQKEINQL